MGNSLIIDCISDTHGYHGKIDLPGGDILIHSGDCSSEGDLEEVLVFLDWFKAQKYSHRLLIPGNHDSIFELIPDLMEEECKRRHILLLNDSGCEIEGMKIWGSPVQPTFFDMAFNRNRGPDIKKHWDLIPNNTEILITHGPPYGIRDEVFGPNDFKKNVGCKDLYQKIIHTQIKLHVFGHIHLGAGITHLGERIFVNAASFDESESNLNGSGYVRIIHKPSVLCNR